MKNLSGIMIETDILLANNPTTLLHGFPLSLVDRCFSSSRLLLAKIHLDKTRPRMC
jgi:hypothetical protein